MGYVWKTRAGNIQEAEFSAGWQALSWGYFEKLPPYPQNLVGGFSPSAVGGWGKGRIWNATLWSSSRAYCCIPPLRECRLSLIVRRAYWTFWNNPISWALIVLARVRVLLRFQLTTRVCCQKTTDKPLCSLFSCARNSQKVSPVCSCACVVSENYILPMWIELITALFRHFAEISRFHYFTVILGCEGFFYLF